LSFDIQAIINKAIRNDNRIDGAGKSYLRQEGSRKKKFGSKLMYLSEENEYEKNQYSYNFSTYTFMHI